MGFGENCVTLSRTEARKLADVFAPIVRQHGSRSKAAEALGVSESVLQKAVCGRAGTAMHRDTLATLARVGGLDTKGWG
jgi:hypothetical protein